MNARAAAGGPLLLAMGTRPEFVKLAPLVAELDRRAVPRHLVVTGQHHDDVMCDRFIGGLRIDERWDLPTSGPERIAELTRRAEITVAAVRPRAVVVLGDTHTVPIFALAARRAGVAVVHVEAGLRSLNEQSVEEVNRKIATAAASLHFAPTETAARFLRHEGVPEERIHVVGNTAIDALASSGMGPVPDDERHGVLVTAHRPTNVDGDALTDLVACIVAVHREIGPVGFPVHPRTRARLVETGLWSTLTDAGVVLDEPVDHATLLDRLRRSTLVVTDSGGLQEEAAFFGVPAVVLRRSTPRWEGIAAGTAALTRLDPAEVVDAARRVSSGGRHHDLYGDGDAAARIVDVLTSGAVALLELREPDHTDGSLPDVLDPAGRAPVAPGTA